ncbi:rho guanine nucleotide exchange factor 19 [Paramormyrops kingsleyae]|uniref:Si:ch73-15b2.5 n=1 Tax=Paramormyrops kingsleyae TaxID=1676925 RepID=A0A3B3R6D9_9TELE|nr:rho guanine nucleotide exchange factor 19-like [Paramormyrops kingsleyae]XP_023686671.1 rho guanine nucleotide exchange factor 19-like [Paramormyrops kingsleyae]
MSAASDELNGLETGRLWGITKQQDDQKCEDLLEALYSPAGGIAAALRSVASWNTWNHSPAALSPGPRFTFPGQDEPQNVPPPMASPYAEVPGKRGYEISLKESDKDVTEITSASKYCQSSPLYQEYCLQSVQAEMQRIQGSDLSALAVAISLPGLLKCHSATTTSSPPAPRSFHQEKGSLLWQDLPEVREQGLLMRLGRKEIKLQEAMFELIRSEASYLKSLTVVVTHFRGSQTLRLSLPTVEHHFLFSNLLDVQRMSERFLLDLEARLGQNVMMKQIGDLVLQHHAALRRVYVPYITNMMYQETLLKRLMQENRGFVQALKKLEQDPACQRQNLKSFLVLPFQRITRLRIVLENILKLTPLESDPVTLTKEAIMAVHQILKECDDSVQRMKQTEKLVALEKQLDFKSVKSLPLISHRRHLVQEGCLRQVLMKGLLSKVLNIHLHLFNDLLLLSLRGVSRFHVLDYARFPAHVSVGQVKTKLHGLPQHCFQLHFSKNHSNLPADFVLAANAGSERDVWIGLLSPQGGDTTIKDAGQTS